MSVITYTRRCNHCLEPVNLGSVTIHCSAHKDSNDRDTNPDFGLYADYRWSPTWRNEFIDWPDFGTPNNPDIAVSQISDAYNLALAGKIVEIGCIGGHGRTGTILACMAVHHLRIGFEEAIDFVRNTYCDHAIETTAQEIFIHYYEKALNG